MKKLLHDDKRVGMEPRPASTPLARRYRGTRNVFHVPERRKAPYQDGDPPTPKDVVGEITVLLLVLGLLVLLVNVVLQLAGV